MVGVILWAAPVRAAGPEDPLPLGFLPRGELFRPLTADPRWPHFSWTYRQYLGSRLGNVGAPTIGETLTIYRADAGGRAQWEVGLLSAVFPLLDLDTPSWDLINADYVLGGYGAYREGPFATVLRLAHHSSHLGDELILREAVERVNLSFEKMDLLLSRDIAGVLRLYGGPGLLVHRQPQLDRWSGQVGVELRPAWQMGGFQPVLGVDVQSRQYAQWGLDGTLRAGLETATLPALQVLLEYFSGRSFEGQFFQDEVEYVGLGLHLRL